MALLRRLILLFGWACGAAAQAAVGLLQLPGSGDDGPITVFYPSRDGEAPVQRGPFALRAAWQGAPQPGNGRLVVVSHGSGGVPWVQADLARALVQAGYVVAMPQHRGDHAGDMSLVGPASWRLRPLEVSRAHRLAPGDARFAAQLADVYGILDRPADADRMLAKRIVPAGDAAVVHMNLGVGSAKRGALADAESRFRRAIALDPGLARAHLYLAEVLLRRGQPGKAIPEFETYLRLAPDGAGADVVRHLKRQLEEGTGRAR